MADGVVLADGSRLAASAVILAVPSWALETLLPGSFPGRDILVRASALPVSPILSLHLWYPDDFMEDDALGLIGRTVQWVFNRRKLAPPDANSPNLAGAYLCAVISAAHQELEKSNEDLLASAMNDLRAVFGSELPDPEDALVVREKRATISCSPASERMRPAQEIPVR